MTLPCEDCGIEMEIGIHRSGECWYVGFWCDRCGPYSRVSEYYLTWDDADVALKSGDFGR